jgi:hypothetical protein
MFHNYRSVIRSLAFLTKMRVRSRRDSPHTSKLVTIRIYSFAPLFIRGLFNDISSIADYSVEWDDGKWMID